MIKVYPSDEDIYVLELLGHIATKTLDFEKTIAITNGMPILRTSVDHGTAFDIAGKGIVSEVSMVEAILLAAKYAPNFRK